METSLSIIIPFYKKMEEFRLVYPHNYAIFKDLEDCEVVIALDNNRDEKALLRFLQNYSDVNYTIIINDQIHKWRNPAKAINVGIMAAKKINCLVISPESVIDQQLLPEMFDMKNENNFVVGVLHTSSINEDTLDFQNVQNTKKHYGSIMFSRSDALAVTGYNEQFREWGCDDDDFRKRLTLNGKKMIPVPAGVIHFKNHEKPDNVQRLRINVKRLKTNKKVRVNTIWGKDFSRKIEIPKASDIQTIAQE